MDEHFKIVDMGEEGMDHVLLTKGKYKDVEFQYGEVKLIEEDNSLRVSFIYEVFDNPSKVDTTTKEFNDYIGKILVAVLDEELLRSLYKKGSR